MKPEILINVLTAQRNEATDALANARAYIIALENELSAVKAKVPPEPIANSDGPNSCAVEEQ